MDSDERSACTARLIDAGRSFDHRGWVLGTSGNVSVLVQNDPLTLWITASGNAKGDLDATHFLEVGDDDEVVDGSGRPSAETPIHLALYRLLPDTGSVMHTHSVWGTILSDEFFEKGAIEIEGYEMLKGLSGVASHTHKEIVPVIENSQDYVALAGVIENVVRNNSEIHGIYLHRHGLYTWGRDIAEARRHVEIFEFLFEVIGRRLK